MRSDSYRRLEGRYFNREVVGQRLQEKVSTLPRHLSRRWKEVRLPVQTHDGRAVPQAPGEVRMIVDHQVGVGFTQCGQ